MAANTVNRSGNGARSGAQTLALLAAQLNVLVLRALADGPKQQAELRGEAGLPAQTTLRAQLKRLVAIGALDKHRRDSFPGVLEYGLTAAGRDLLFVAITLERWLERAPDGPLPLGGPAAKAAVKALAEGWSSTMLRALAAGPLSLTQLDGVIGSLSYPSLERRLVAMRLTGQVEACRGNGRGRPYAVTEWLRHGVAPLLVAARWERRHRAAAATPLGRLDTETVFLLALPLLCLPVETAGTCRMAAEIANGDGRLAGVMTVAQNGRIVSSTTELNGKADTWVLGPAAAWLNALIEHDTAKLEIGGDCNLARALLAGLHDALFPSRADAMALDARRAIGDDGLN